MVISLLVAFYRSSIDVHSHSWFRNNNVQGIPWMIDLSDPANNIEPEPNTNVVTLTMTRPRQPHGPSRSLSHRNWPGARLAVTCIYRSFLTSHQFSGSPPLQSDPANSSTIWPNHATRATCARFHKVIFPFLFSDLAMNSRSTLADTS